MKGSNSDVQADEGFDFFDGDGDDLDIDYNKELEGVADKNKPENAEI